MITPPVRTKTVAPVYPAIARAAKWEGDVVLQAEIGADGRVGDVTVLRSSVYPLLDAAARTAVLRYEYTPGERNGVPEAMTVLPITVQFRLQD
jgi:protein TonB